MATPIITRAVFQLDTQIKDGPPRASDSILLEIDRLLDAFHGSKAGPEQMAYLGKLLFAADRWLKHPRAATPWRQLTADEAFSQRATIEQFRAAVLRRLMEETRLGNEAGVRVWLEKTFANPRTKAMEDQDRDTGAKYYTATELENFRLVFMNGIVWIKRWWENGLQHDVVRFDTPTYTSHFKTNVRPGADADTSPDHANFVLTMDGEFYSTWHVNGRMGRFHSAYTGGKPVYFAGEILIRNGMVVAINNRSGHYMPDIYKLRDVIEMLQMLGVNISEVVVSDWATKSPGLPMKTFKGQELLDAYPARYVVDGDEPRRVLLGRRVAGIQDVMITPLFRSRPPSPIDGYDNIMDNLDSLLSQELASQAKLMKLRALPVTPSIRATLRLQSDNAGTYAPVRDTVKHWGVDLVLIPEFVFDLRRAQCGRFTIRCLVVSKQLDTDVEEEGQYYDLTKGALTLVKKVAPMARNAIQKLIQIRDG